MQPQQNRSVEQKPSGAPKTLQKDNPRLREVKTSSGQSTSKIALFLQQAAEQEDRQQIVSLLAHSNIDPKTPEGISALHQATRAQQWECVDVLVKEGVDPQAVDENGLSYLFHLVIAAPNGNIFKRQLENLLKTVGFLFLKLNQLFSTKDKNGKTILHHAAEQGKAEIIPLLVKDYNLAVNEKDNRGCTPLHLAAEQGHLPAVEELYKLKANHYLLDNMGNNAIHAAESARNIPVLQFLAARHAESFQKSTDPTIVKGWEEAVGARINYFDLGYEKAFYQAQQEKHAQASEIQADLKESIPKVEEAELLEQFRVTQYDKIRNSLIQLIGSLEPDNPTAASALLMVSDLYLLKASHWSRLWKSQLQRGEENHKVFQTAMSFYRAAMQYAVCSQLIESRYVEEAYQYPNFSQLTEAQIKRIITRFRHEVFIHKVGALSHFLNYKSHREDLRKHRAKLKKEIGNIKLKIQEVAKRNTEYFKALTKELWEEALSLMEEKPPCPYALMGLGSMARDMMAPYSDIEFAAVTERDSENNKDIFLHRFERRYFKIAASLMELLTIALGETPTPPLVRAALEEEEYPITFQHEITLESLMVSGFQFDNGGQCTPAGDSDAFLCTVSQLIQIQEKAEDKSQGVTDDKALVQSNILRTTCFITGDSQLYQGYRNQLKLFLEENLKPSYFNWFNKSSTRNKVSALQAMQQYIKDFESSLVKMDIGVTKKDFNVKKNWYHFPSRILDALALYYKLSALNDFERIKELRGHNYLSMQGADILHEFLSRTMRLRFSAHLHYESEEEEVYLPDSIPQLTHRFEKGKYILSSDQFEKIVALYQTLNPLQKASGEFVKQDGQTKIFATSSLYDKAYFRLDEREKCRLKAEAYEKLNHPKQAMHWYQIAFSLDPTNEAIQANFLCFLSRQYDERIEDLKGIDKQGAHWVEHLVKISVEQSLPAEVYRSYLEHMPSHSFWREAFYKAIRACASGQYQTAILAILPSQNPDMGEGQDEEVLLAACKKRKELFREGLKKEWQEEKIAATVNKKISKLDEEEKVRAAVNKNNPAETIWAFSEMRVRVYDDTLKSKDTTPLQKTLLILQGFSLLEKVLFNKKEALNTAKCDLDRMLRMVVGYLLGKGLSIPDYVRLYQKFPYALRESFRLAIQTQKRRPSDKKEVGVEHKQASISQPTSRNISVSQDFLESLLKELNCVPDSRGERPIWEKHKMEWKATLQSFITKPHGIERKSAPLTLQCGFASTERDDSKKYEAELNPQIQEMLFTKDYDFKGQIISGGRHPVAKIEVTLANGLKRRVYCKVYPEMPGMSFLIERLHHQLIGHGTNLSELVNIVLPDKSVLPILISEAIEGETLEQVLKDKPQRLKKLSHRHISELALVAMITNPEDGSPSNYIVQRVEVDHEYYDTLVSIDHDRALFQAYDDYRENKEGVSRPTLQVKTILFCLDNMLLPIDPKVRDALCHLDAGAVLRAVLKEAKDQNEAYDKIFKNLITKLHETRAIDKSSTIPIPLKQGDTIKIYQKIQRLQRFLQNEENANATLLECLFQVEPRVGLAYSQVLSLKKLPGERLNIVGEYRDARCISRNLARQSLLIRTRMGKTEYAKLDNLDPVDGLVELDEMDEQYLNIAEVQAEVLEGKLEGFDALKAEDHKAMVINGVKDTFNGMDIHPLDWRKLRRSSGRSDTQELDESADNSPQRILLKAIQGISFKQLQLAYCDALTRPILKSILTASPDLTELDLSYHPQMRYVSLLVLDKHPGLQVLKLKGMAQLDALQNLALPALKVLIVTDAPELQVISINAPRLKVLRIARCPQLTQIKVESRVLEEISCNGAEQLEPVEFRKAIYWFSIKRIKLDQCPQFNSLSELLDYPYLIPLLWYTNMGLVKEIKSAIIEKIGHENVMALPPTAREKLVAGSLLFPHTLRLPEGLQQQLWIDIVDEELETRRIACKALGKIILAKPELGEEALEYLEPLLECDNEEVRRTACITLGEIVKVNPHFGEIALEWLEPRLGDINEEVRSTACEVLSGIVSHVPELGKIALKDLLSYLYLADKYTDDETLPASALEKLLEEKPSISDRELNQLRPSLPTLIQDPAYTALCKIISIKPELGGKALHYLQPHLEDEDISSRRTACKAISKIVMAKPELGNSALLRLLSLESDERSEVQEAGCRAVGDIISVKPDLGKIAFECLLPLLTDEREAIQIAASEAIGKIVKVKPELGEEALTHLLPLFKIKTRSIYYLENYIAMWFLVDVTKMLRVEEEEDPYCRRRLSLKYSYQSSLKFKTLMAKDKNVSGAIYTALQAIVTTKPEFMDKAFDQLLQFLTDPNGIRRRDACWFLAYKVKVKPKSAHEALTHLQTLLKDKEYIVRAEACGVLREIANVMPELGEIVLQHLKQLLKDKDFFVREEAYTALSNIVRVSRDPELQNKALKLFFQAFSDKEAPVRMNGCRELEWIISERPDLTEKSLEYFKLLLSDELGSIRQSACISLGEAVVVNPALGEKVIKLLLPALVDKSRLVRGDACMALGKIGKANPFMREKALGYLLPLLSGDSADDRKYICLAIAEMQGITSILPKLKETVLFPLFVSIGADKAKLPSEVARKTLNQILENDNPILTLDVFFFLKPFLSHRTIAGRGTAIDIGMKICADFCIYMAEDLPTYLLSLFKKLKEFYFPKSTPPVTSQSKKASKPSAPLNHSHPVDSKSTPFLVEEKKEEQRGWNCFDIAIDLPRERLVNFALEHKQDIRYRKMLAPEIRTAAAITAIMINMQEEKEMVAQKQAAELAELFNLFDIARQFGSKEDQKEITSSIHSLLSTPNTSSDDRGLAQLALPKSMRTSEVQKLVNAYNKAHEDIKPLLAQCNNLIGKPEGQRLSYDDLRLFFSKPANRIAHGAAWNIFDEALKQFIPHETALNNYCEREETYESYVKEYYGQKQWFAFQPASSGRQNSSMVDIAACCLAQQIIVYQMKGQEREEIYRTTEHRGEIAYVQYNGYNHFIKLKLNLGYVAAVEKRLLKVFGLYKTSSTSDQPSEIETKNSADRIPKIISGYLV